MTQISVGENESIESALRRFEREVTKAGIFSDLKKHRHERNSLAQAQARGQRSCQV
jgi:small subunit ribosomal protein S21